MSLACPRQEMHLPQFRAMLSILQPEVPPGSQYSDPLAKRADEDSLAGNGAVIPTTLAEPIIPSTPRTSRRVSAMREEAECSNTGKGGEG